MREIALQFRLYMSAMACVNTVLIGRKWVNVKGENNIIKYTQAKWLQDSTDALAIAQ